MNSYTMETIARQQFAATARRAEAVGSRSRTSRRRSTRVSFQFPTFAHVSIKEAR
jgi:hypothetical protein